MLTPRSRRMSKEREKMAIEIVNPDGVPAPVGPYSHAAVVEPGARIAYLSGQVAANSLGELEGIGDFQAQFRAATANLEKLLNSLGASFDDVAYVRGYLARASDLPAYREERERLYGKMCKKGPPPTTTVVVAALYHPDCLIEVDAVAVLHG